MSARACLSFFFFSFRGFPPFPPRGSVSMSLSGSAADASDDVWLKPVDDLLLVDCSLNVEDEKMMTHLHPFGS